MRLSSTAQLALHGVFSITGSADGPVRIDGIAAGIRCSRTYLSKTPHALTRAGALRSERGPGGASSSPRQGGGRPLMQSLRNSNQRLPHGPVP